MREWSEMFTKRFWSAFMTDLIETESIRSGSFEFQLTILYPNTVAISRRPQFSDHLLTRLQHRQKLFNVFHIQYWWQWCWWHRYVGGFMMVTGFRCWWQNHYVGDFFRYVGDFTNVNRSPTFWIGHQHLKLVTNTFGLQHPSSTSM